MIKIKNFLNKLLNPNYKKAYSIYKKMPGIVTIILAAFFFIWSIVDVIVFSDIKFVKEYSVYGVMGVSSPILVFIIWWAIAAVVCSLTWFFSTLTVSANVVKIDSVIEIKESLKNN